MISARHSNISNFDYTIFKGLLPRVWLIRRVILASVYLMTFFLAYTSKIFVVRHLYFLEFSEESRLVLNTLFSWKIFKVPLLGPIWFCFAGLILFGDLILIKWVQRKFFLYASFVLNSNLVLFILYTY